MGSIKKIFKSYIANSGGYAGGKSVGEIGGTIDKVYKLSSNENLNGSSPMAIAALKNSLDNNNIYPDGTPHRLRNALSEFYDGTFAADQFIVGNGGSEIIDLIIRAVMTDDTECIISNPCFSPYKMFSSWSGGTVIDVPLLMPDYSLDVEGILAAINDRTRLIFLTTPNNPTGTYIPKAKVDHLLANIPDHIIVVYDEVYFQYADAEDFARAIPYVKEGKNVIAINSFSKAYGLAAIRLGYAYTTKEIADYIHKICKPFYINSMNIAAGVAALQDVDFINKTVRVAHTEKPRIYTALDENGYHYWPSQANFILIKPKMDDVEFVHQMQLKGIMLRPASLFGAPGCVRITIGDQESTDVLIRALADLA